MDSAFNSLAMQLGPDARQGQSKFSLLLAALAATLMGTVPPAVLTQSDRRPNRRTGER